MLKSILLKLSERRTALLCVALTALLAAAVCEILLLSSVSVRKYVADDYAFGVNQPVHPVIPVSDPRCRRDWTIDFRVNETEVVDLANVFQTDSVNSGIRMEIDGRGRAGLAVAANNSDGLLGFPLHFLLLPDGSHDIHIEWRASGRVKVAIDGSELLDQSDSAFKPVFGDFRFGRGFSDERVFHGEISNIRLTERVLPRHVAAYGVIVMTGLAIAVLAFSCLLALYFAERRNEVVARCYGLSERLLAIPSTGGAVIAIAGIFVAVAGVWFYVSSSMITFYRDDNVIGNMPLLMESCSQILHGKLPVHSEYIGGGMPILAAMQIGSLDPFAFMAALFGRYDPLLTANLDASIHLGVFAAGAAYLGAMAAAPLWALLVAGMSLGFSGYVASHFGAWPGMAAPYCFVPWIMGAMGAVINPGRRAWPHALILFLSAVICVFSGGPNPMIPSVIPILAWFVIMAVRYRPTKARWFVLAGVVAASLLAVAPLLHSALEFVQLFGREHYESYFKDLSVPFSAYLGLLFPNTGSLWEHWWEGFSLFATNTVMFCGCVPLWVYLGGIPKWKEHRLWAHWPLWAGFVCLFILMSPNALGITGVFVNIPIVNLLRLPVRGAGAMAILCVSAFLVLASGPGCRVSARRALALILATALLCASAWQLEIRVFRDNNMRVPYPFGWINGIGYYRLTSRWPEKTLAEIRATGGQTLSIDHNGVDYYMHPLLYFYGNTGAQFRVQTVGFYMPTYPFPAYRPLAFRSTGTVVDFEKSLPFLERRGHIKPWDNGLSPLTTEELIAKTCVTAVVLGDIETAGHAYMKAHAAEWVLADRKDGATLYLLKEKADCRQ